jgi:hypothetical protein
MNVDSILPQRYGCRILTFLFINFTYYFTTLSLFVFSFQYEFFLLSIELGINSLFCIKYLIEDMILVYNHEEYFENKLENKFLEKRKYRYLVFTLLSCVNLFCKNRIPSYDDIEIINILFLYNGIGFFIIASLYILKNKERNSNSIQPINETIEIRINIILNKEDFINRILATRKFIDSNNKENCPICFEPFYNSNQEQNFIMILNCKHEYDENCLYQCYKNNIKKCPQCRLPFII